jgi:hypothetical protein
MEYDRLTSKELWTRLTPALLKEQLREHSIEQRAAACRRTLLAHEVISDIEANWMTDMHRDFFGVLDTITPASANISGSGNGISTDITTRINYCERFLEWTIDLLTQAQTRCFFLAFLIDTHFIERCLLSSLYHMRSPILLSATNGTPKEVGELDEDAESDDDIHDGGQANGHTKKSGGNVARTAPGPGKLFAQLLDMVKYYRGV